MEDILTPESFKQIKTSLKKLFNMENVIRTSGVKLNFLQEDNTLTSLFCYLEEDIKNIQYKEIISQINSKYLKKGVLALFMCKKNTDKHTNGYNVVFNLFYLIDDKIFKYVFIKKNITYYTRTRSNIIKIYNFMKLINSKSIFYSLFCLYVKKENGRNSYIYCDINDKDKIDEIICNNKIINCEIPILTTDIYFSENNTNEDEINYKFKIDKYNDLTIITDIEKI